MQMVVYSLIPTLYAELSYNLATFSSEQGYISVPPDSPGPMSSLCWRGQGLPGCWVDQGSGRNAKYKAKHNMHCYKAEYETFF